MSLNISETSYSGSYASYFWLPATFSMDTVQKGVVFIQDGIKKSHTIGRIDFKNPLQPRQATPVPKGDFTLTGRVLTPQDMMCYTEFNPRDFESNFLAEQLSRNLLDRELPVTAENYMLQLALNRVFEQIELGLWQGSTSFAGRFQYGDPQYQIQFFDGFMKKFLNDANIFQAPSPLPLVSTVSVGGTSKNILEAMDSLISAATVNNKGLIANVKKFERMKFIVSPATELIYNTALIQLAYKGAQPMDGSTLPYKGYKIISLAGVPENTIIFTEAVPDTSSNLYIGENSTDDNQLQLSKLQANSELFFIKGLMKFDVQYGWSENIFLYTTQTSANYN